MLRSAVDFSHELLKQTVSNGDTVIDATVGKGNDTLLLASLVGVTGKVIGFDIQDEAIKHTETKLLLTGLSSVVQLHTKSHAEAAQYLEPDEFVGGVIFNLGYLPGGNKEITTQSSSTIEAIQSLLPRLRVGSLIVLVIYAGHPSGKVEKDAVLAYVQSLDQKHYSVLQYGFINQRNHPPFVVAIERK